MKNYLRSVLLLTISLLFGGYAFSESLSDLEKSCSINSSRNISWKKIDIKGSLTGSEDGRDKLVEFFSYVCVHCYKNQDVMEKIYRDVAEEKSLDLIFIPLSFNANMEEAAKLYWALKENNVHTLDIHQNIFSAFHKQKKPIFSDRVALTAFLYSQLNDGPLVSKVISTMDSNQVKKWMDSIREGADSLGVEGIPSVVISSATGVGAIITREGVNKDEGEMYKAIRQFIPKKCRAAMNK